MKCLNCGQTVPENGYENRRRFRPGWCVPCFRRDEWLKKQKLAEASARFQKSKMQHNVQSVRHGQPTTRQDFP